MRVGNKDNGGTYLNLFNVTLLTNVDWLYILNQNKGKEMHLCTFDNPNAEKVQNAVSLIKGGKVIIGTLSQEKSWDIVRNFTNVKIKHDSHAKMLLIAPDEVYLSSQNIEHDDWFQTTVYIKDKRAYDHYLDQFYCEWFAEEIPHWPYATNIITPEDEIRYCSMQFPQSIIGKKSADPKKMFLRSCSCKMAASKNWKTKISGVKNSSVIITTQTMPNQRYVCECLDLLLKHNNAVTLVANVEDKLIQKLREIYPQVKIYHCSNIHSKMILHSGNNVWLSSQNFGNSGKDWFESAIQIKDSRAYEFYYNQLCEFLGQGIE